jgi:hypothetical protein
MENSYSRKNNGKEKWMMHYPKGVQGSTLYITDSVAHTQSISLGKTGVYRGAPN